MGKNGNFNSVFKVHLGVRPRSAGRSEEAVLAGGRSNQSPPNVSNETKIYFLLIIPPISSLFPQGRMNTNIKYNITSKRWELRHLHSPNYALLTDKRATSEDVYPIGR